MVFLQPLFLYGLFLLAIPILIHFLNFRKSKTLYFSSLRFIEEVKSTYRKRNNLTDLLLLLLRLLILACLIIAFAQPVIQSKNNANSSVSSISGLFIDNSQSMELAEKGETLFAKAKTVAKELVREFPPDSKFQLLYYGSSNSSTGLIDKELTLSLIDGITLSEVQMQMNDVLRFFSQANQNNASRISSIILISDFQESMFTHPIERDSNNTRLFPVILKPLSNSNISVDSCWLENPMTLLGENNVLIARINNRSDQDYEEFPVRLIINDTLRNETTTKLAARTSVEVNLSFHPNSRGWQTGSVQISDFPVVFDNDLLFSFKIESDIRVLLLHGGKENPYLRSVYGDDPYFKYESFNENGFPRSDFKDYNLVILSGIKGIDTRLNSKVRDFMQGGGTIWLLPELSGQVSDYNEFLKSINVPPFQNLLSYRTESKIGSGQTTWLQGVVVNIDKRLRLPYFNQSLRITPLSPNRTDFLNSVSGDILLSQFRFGSGSFVLSGFPLDEKVTDFMFHPLFIPICYRIATMSQHNFALYQTNGSNQPVIVNLTNNSGSTIRLRNKKTNFETSPVQHPGNGKEAILFPESLPSSGIYHAISGTDTLSSIAFNTSRAESNLIYPPDSTIRNRFKKAGWNISVNNNSVKDINSKVLVNEIASKKIWYYFLIIALMGLMAESFVMNVKK